MKLLAYKYDKLNPLFMETRGVAKCVRADSFLALRHHLLLVQTPNAPAVGKNLENTDFHWGKAVLTCGKLTDR